VSGPILAVDRLSGGYGPVTVMRDVSIEVEQGSIVALLGSNGAGKSTLLKTVAGLLKPSAGSVRLRGAEMNGAGTEKLVRAGVVMVPEGRQLFPTMTVGENLRLGAYLSRRDRAGFSRRLGEVVELFPALTDRMDEEAGRLSGGQQQMVAIGRALMSDPSLLLLDEPSLGLAPLVLKEVFGAVAHLREQGVTTLIVEQNARMTLEYADRGYVMERGRVVLSGDASGLLEDERVRSAYLGAGVATKQAAGSEETTEEE
jgi:branched-chain amino acid transport system ATP-binding protein